MSDAPGPESPKAVSAKRPVEAERADHRGTFQATITGETEAEQLSTVLGALYDAVLDPERWSDALRLAAAFLDGVAANLFWQDPINHQAVVFQKWGDNPRYVQSYFERYAPLNPLFPAASFVPVGVVFSGGDLMPHEDFHLTRFYREWVAPQGFIDVAGVNLHRFAVGTSAFSVRRSREQGIVDDVMRRRLELLAPHLQRAVVIGRELDAHRTKTLTLEAVLHRVNAAVFVVDQAGRVDFVNKAATALLDARDMVVRRDGIFGALDRAADRSLRAAYVEAMTPDKDRAILACPPPVALTNSRQERHLAHVLPIARPAVGIGAPDRAVVFIRKAEVPVISSLEIMARLHGLTASEIKVLEAVVTRGSTAEIAAALGIGVATVKTHLAALFAKTGTRRRSELVGAVAAHGHSLI